MTVKELNQRRRAANVCFTYMSLCSRGGMQCSSRKHLDVALHESLERNDPQGFCWSFIVHLSVGGVEIPEEERALFTDLERWARIALPAETPE